LKPNIRLLDEISEFEKLALQDFSYSRINAFDWCQAQYFYNYILKIPQEPGDKALLGNMIHTALEVTLVDGEKLSLAELLDNYRAAREEHDPDQQYVSDELFESGIPMLQEFVMREGPSAVRITEPEFAFQFVFAGVLIRGFIDRVLITDTEVIITDYKTGAWEVPDKEVPYNLQLGIYALYMKYLHSDKKITAMLHYLKSNKLKKHSFSDEEFSDVENRLAEAIEKIRENNNYTTLPKGLAWKCRMCSYQKDGTCAAGRFNVEQAEKKKNKLISYDPYS
jgi:RecB family exonuclease